MQFYMLLGLLTVCGHAFSLDGPVCDPELLANTDFLGDDVIDIMTAEPLLCLFACTEHPTCQFFTYNIQNFKCFLKHSVSGQPTTIITEPMAIAGFALKGCDPPLYPCSILHNSVYPDMDFPGQDFLSLFTDNYEECQRACTDQPGCQAFTFLTENFTPEQFRYKCHLKFLWTVPRPLKLRPLPKVSSGFSKKLELHLKNKTGVASAPCSATIFTDSDVKGGDLEQVPAVSAEHCQHLCTAHPLCSYFTYNRLHYTCNLKNNKETMAFVTELNMFTGMPTRYCTPSSDWVYADYEGVDFYGSDKTFVMLDDKESCRKACDEDPDCQFYTYLPQSFVNPLLRRHCYLKQIITLPLPPKVAYLPNVVSGLSWDLVDWCPRKPTS